MNLFTAWKDKETGQPTLVTAPLDGTILEGVTRDSILALARERLAPQGWSIEERKYTMQEISDAADEGRILEIFGAGTAAVVSPVRRISWKGRLLNCGLPEDQEAGPIAQQMKDWIEGIQRGEEEGHEWRSVLFPVLYKMMSKLTFFLAISSIERSVPRSEVDITAPALLGSFGILQYTVHVVQKNLARYSNCHGDLIEARGKL